MATRAAAPDAEAKTLETDVSGVDETRALEAAISKTFGGTDVLMNYAGVQPAVACSDPKRAGSACAA